MKCPICGADAPIDSNTCPSCGYAYFKGNDQMQGNNSAIGSGNPYNNFNNKSFGAQNSINGFGYQNNNGFGYQNNSFGYQSSFGASSSTDKKTTILVIFALLIVVAVVGFYFIRNGTGTKEYKFDNFSITLPSDLDKVKDSKFASTVKSFQSFDSMNAEEYVGKQVRFAYAVTGDYSKLVTDESQKATLAAVLNPTVIVDQLSSNYSAKKGYKEVKKTNDTLCFVASDSNGKMTYNQIKVIIEDYRMYMLFLLCNENNRSKYEDKFDDWFGTFKTN